MPSLPQATQLCNFLFAFYIWSSIALFIQVFRFVIYKCLKFTIFILLGSSCLLLIDSGTRSFLLLERLGKLGTCNLGTSVSRPIYFSIHLLGIEIESDVNSYRVVHLALLGKKGQLFHVLFSPIILLFSISRECNFPRCIICSFTLSKRARRVWNIFGMT